MIICRIKIAGITVFSVIAILLFVYFFIKRPITRLTEKLYDIKPENSNVCNLNIKVPEKSKDEIGAIGRHINRLLQEIKSMVESITIAHKKLADASESLAASSQETSASAFSVSEAINNITESAHSQLAEAERGNSKMSILSDNLSDIVTNAEYMKNSTNETGNVTKAGLTSVLLLKKVAKDNDELILEMSEHVNGLTDKFQAISSIVDAIADIATQTNLLSLNASIEAARAGAAGKGFAIVANEVRILAEQSKISAQNIQNLLSVIGGEIKEIAGLMNSITKTFLEQNAAVSNTETAFGNISESISKTITNIEKVSASLFEMEAKKAEIICSIESISQTSAHSSNSMEEINSSIQDMSLAIESVAILAKDLNDISSNLKSQIESFIF